MPSTHLSRLLVLAGAWAALTFWPGQTVLADGNRPPTASLPSHDASARVLAPPRPRASAVSSDSASGWWFGSAGIVAALAVFGGVSLASKRFLPARDSGPIQVVGRSALSSKHSVYLLRVGDRVLILGAGPQGPPTTLGEVTDPAELARLAPRRTLRSAPEPPVVSTRPSTGFDRRIGEDE